MVNKTTFKQYLLEAKMPLAQSVTDLFDSIVNGKFTKDGSKLKVTGFFQCNNTKTLISLEGAPQEVNYFDCENNLKLTSLKGGPQTTNDGGFYCEKNPKLTSLEGAPQTVGGEFYCKKNLGLISLEGAPQKVGFHFKCENNTKLTSLKGGPQFVYGWFYCNNNDGLTSLEGAPQKVGGNFQCRNNPKLTSLTRINFYIHEIGGDADFLGCPIESNILGLLKIRGLSRVFFDDKQLEEIVNRHLPMGDSTDCIDDLLDAGYSKEYCKW